MAAFMVGGAAENKRHGGGENCGLGLTEYCHQEVHHGYLTRTTVSR
jgi:hypothetical protein